MLTTIIIVMATLGGGGGGLPYMHMIQVFICVAGFRLGDEVTLQLGKGTILICI